MKGANSLQVDEPFSTDLRKHARRLIEQLQNCDYQGASKLIQGMVEERDRQLVISVGQLTRALHNAMINLHLEGDDSSDSLPVGSSEIHEASERLQHVIQMTQIAADKTLDRVEASAPIATGLEQEAQCLRQEWTRLKAREMTAEEFGALYWQLDDFLEQVTKGANLLNSHLKDIVLEQSYQDLSGQLLGRVIALMGNVENELIRLIRIAAQVEEVTGSQAPDTDPETGLETEKPGKSAPQRKLVESGQDDVDDLLSSLGF
jgi:chemotaxis protein CheZ